MSKNTKSQQRLLGKQYKDKCCEKVQEKMPRPPTDLDISNRLLDNAVNEIQQLREINRVMNARLTMFDTVVSLVKTDIYGRNSNDCCDCRDIISEIKYHTGKK